MRVGTRKARDAANPMCKKKTVFRTGFPPEPGPDSGPDRE